MTYKELENTLAELTTEQKEKEVTVFVQGLNEYYTVVNDYPFIVDNKPLYLVI